MNLEDASAGRRAVTFLRLPARIRRRSGRILIAFVMAALVAVGWCEATTSWVEARLLSRYDRNLRFAVSSGPSPAIAFPRSGPYDTNFGYRFIPVFARRLAPEGFDIAAQARMSPTMLSVVRMGLYPPYREKDQAGLVLRDSRGAVFYEARFPDSVYRTFQSVPPVLANTLAYIEDRHLLDVHPATRNPAISWGRFTRALFDQARHLVEPEAPTPGGSTLATQIEKFRHSPGGYTANGTEKLRQMASASLWAYLGGPDTGAARRRIVVDYLNTVPLSARAGWARSMACATGCAPGMAAIRATSMRCCGPRRRRCRQGRWPTNRRCR